MNIDPKQISGNWSAGWALDVHTIKSEHVGYNQFGRDVFDNTYSEIGQALYKLKSGRDKTQIDPIAKTAAQFIQSQPSLKDVSAVVAVPPSDTARQFQHVSLLAEAVASKLEIPSPSNYLKKVKQTPQLKNMDSVSKHKELEGAFAVADERHAGDHILVLDDLFGTGETLKAISDALMTQGKVRQVSVLTMTMNRSRR